MIDKQFDDILKRKLKGLIDTRDSDWSTFEQKLDQAQMSEDSDKRDFDDAIQQKLAGMTSAHHSSDWSTFEQILDEDQLTDELLDDTVSKEMNNLRAPYRKDHWDLLHNSLEYQKQRNNSIIGYKVLELCLLVVILLSANNIYKYLPSTFEVEKPLIYANVENSERDINTKKTTVSPLELIDQSKILANATKFDSKVNDPIKTIAPYADSKTSDSDQTIASLPTATNQVMSSNINTLENAVNMVGNNLNETKAILSNGSMDTRAINNNIADNVIHNLIPTTDQSLIYHQDQTESTDWLAPSIATVNIGKVISGNNSESYTLQEISTLNPEFLLPKSKIQKSIAIYAGLDNNLVNSPFDDIYDTEGFRTYGIGFSAGLEYGFQKEKKAITLGLGYSNRAYEPRIIDELTGNPALTLYETSLDHIEFNIMSLSIALKYLLVETDHWAVDIGIGASANVVVNSDYSIETRTIRDGQQVGSRYGRQPSSDLDDKPLHDGIFENGSLKENIYFTTDISLGLQRELSENTFFTLRPEYSVHSFSNGIGPNNDLINNLSLNLGLKYNL